MTTMRAAVLRTMGAPAPYAQSRPLAIETVRLQPPGRARYACACAPRACAIPTCR